MALILETLEIKNFLSVGNTCQTVNFNQQGLTLVLGENIDVGGAGSRNGVGKSTIVQALSYALFGQPLTYIKKDNLINKINLKAMNVSLTFTHNGKSYKIERGRKPNFIRWYVNDQKVDSPDNDEAQGESKWTQHEIEKLIGFNHEVFRNVVVLSTEVIPFLKLGAKDQRTIIEELLGITQLSEKALHLKDYVKETKDRIREEEITIRSILESNDKIKRTIDDLAFKSQAWDKDHVKNVEKLRKAISTLEQINVEEELDCHKNIQAFNEVSKAVKQLQREKTSLEKRVVEQSNLLDLLAGDLAKAAEHNCPTCGQEVHDGKIDGIRESLKIREDEANANLLAFATEIDAIVAELTPLEGELALLGHLPDPYYSTIEQAYNHRADLDKWTNNLERELAMVNPYLEQIVHLQDSGIQEVNYENINDLTRLRDHQEFLLKLLISKDSFIRKKIIDQNLLYLNHRLQHYLEKLNLPHEVRFLNDLNVEITLLGREYDYEQLSTGEKKRVILGLNWAFRDVWESLNQPLNLIFVDELLDSGTDGAGVEAAWEILTRYSRDRMKAVFLISHREELISRATMVLKVVKENGFTAIGYAEKE